MGVPLYTSRQYNIITSAADGDPAELERLRNLNFQLGYNLTDSEREAVMAQGFGLAIRIDPNYSANRMLDQQIQQQNKDAMLSSNASNTLTQQMASELRGDGSSPEDVRLAETISSLSSQSDPIQAILSHKEIPGPNGQPTRNPAYDRWLKMLTPAGFAALFPDPNKFNAASAQLIANDMLKSTDPGVQKQGFGVQSVINNIRTSRKTWLPSQGK